MQDKTSKIFYIAALKWRSARCLHRHNAQTPLDAPETNDDYNTAYDYISIRLYDHAPCTLCHIDRRFYIVEFLVPPGQQDVDNVWGRNQYLLDEELLVEAATSLGVLWMVISEKAYQVLPITDDHPHPRRVLVLEMAHCWYWRETAAKPSPYADTTSSNERAFFWYVLLFDGEHGDYNDGYFPNNNIFESDNAVTGQPVHQYPPPSSSSSVRISPSPSQQQHHQNNFLRLKCSFSKLQLLSSGISATTTNLTVSDDAFVGASPVESARGASSCHTSARPSTRLFCEDVDHLRKKGVPKHVRQLWKQLDLSARNRADDELHGPIRPMSVSSFSSTSSDSSSSSCSRATTTTQKDLRKLRIIRKLSFRCPTAECTICISLLL
uniref:Uncharacterized protein n=1 Tax=Globodera rostochiensis TaxID=31243 RepID=A0A914H5A1_GLORO